MVCGGCRWSQRLNVTGSSVSLRWLVTQPPFGVEGYCLAFWFNWGCTPVKLEYLHLTSNLLFLWYSPGLQSVRLFIWPPDSRPHPYPIIPPPDLTADLSTIDYWSCGLFASIFLQIQRLENHLALLHYVSYNRFARLNCASGLLFKSWRWGLACGKVQEYRR